MEINLHSEKSRDLEPGAKVLLLDLTNMGRNLRVPDSELEKIGAMLSPEVVHRLAEIFEYILPAEKPGFGRNNKQKVIEQDKAEIGLENKKESETYSLSPDGRILLLDMVQAGRNKDISAEDFANIKEHLLPDTIARLRHVFETALFERISEPSEKDNFKAAA